MSLIVTRDHRYDNARREGSTRLASAVCRLLASLGLVVILGGTAPLRAAEAPAPPAAPAPQEKKAEPGQPAAPAPDKKPAEGGVAAPDETKPAGEAAPGEETKPEEGAPAPEPQGPALNITGVRTIEILPRDFEESRRFYVGVLGLHEEDASGGEGERMCVLTGGPLRVRLHEQPGRPALPTRYPWLGINPAPLSETAAEEAGLKEPEGVLVDDVIPQGPAAVAGLAKRDIIVAVEGKPTPTPEALTTILHGLTLGKKAMVTLWRERKNQEIVVEMTACPFPAQLAPTVLHLEVRDLDAYYRELLRRGTRVYAEPRDTPEGGRVLEIVDPNDILISLEEDHPAPETPEKPAAAEPATPPAAPTPEK